jgi:hypothetical protein
VTFNEANTSITRATYFINYSGGWVYDGGGYLAFRTYTSGNYLAFKDASGPLIDGPGGTLNLGVSGTTKMTITSAGAAVTGAITATGDITAFSSSDRSLKKNIVPIANAIEGVKAIRGVRYDWTDEYLKSKGGIDGYFVRANDVGVIAQELQEVLPEAVGQREDGILAVKYERIVPLLIEAIKEQQIQIEKLTKMIEG